MHKETAGRQTGEKGELYGLGWLKRWDRSGVDRISGLRDFAHALADLPRGWVVNEIKPMTELEIEWLVGEARRWREHGEVSGDLKQVLESVERMAFFLSQERETHALAVDQAKEFAKKVIRIANEKRELQREIELLNQMAKKRRVALGNG